MRSKEERRAVARAKWKLGRETRADWFLKKKLWKSSYDSSYRKANAEKKRLSDKAWRDNNLLRARENARRWKLDHPQQHREHVRVAAKTYNKRHPEKGRNHVHKYRMLKLGASRGDPNAVVKYMASVLESSSVDCVYCGIAMDTATKRLITFDHVTPVTRGGLHVPENLRPCCLPCNASKGNRLLVEWLP